MSAREQQGDVCRQEQSGSAREQRQSGSAREQRQSRSAREPQQSSAREQQQSSAREQQQSSAREQQQSSAREQQSSARGQRSAREESSAREQSSARASAAGTAAGAASSRTTPVPQLWRGGLETLGQGPSSVQDYFFKHSQPPRAERPGKRVTGVGPTHSYQEWDFLKNAERSNEEQWRCEGGLKETRFHKGFHRRYREGIEAYHATEVPREQVQFTSTPERRAKLAFVQGEHRGYNIVVGDAASESGSSVAAQARRHPDFPSLAPERNVPRRGKKLLPAPSGEPRMGAQVPTMFKFYQVASDTPLRRERARLLAREGLPLTDKFSTELGFGRNDLPSQGVNDNFGNSYYHHQQSLVRARSEGELG